MYLVEKILTSGNFSSCFAEIGKISMNGDSERLNKGSTNIVLLESKARS